MTVTVERPPGSAYPPSIEALLPLARQFAVELGTLPSQNALRKRFRIGPIKAGLLLAALRAWSDSALTLPDRADQPPAPGDASLTPAQEDPAPPVEAETPEVAEAPPLAPAVAPVVPESLPEPLAVESDEVPPVAPPAVPVSGTDKPAKARGTGPFYLVALIASLISIDTALKFFDLRLLIDGEVSFTLPLWSGMVWRVEDAPVERWALSGVIEITLIACGYAMRHAVRRPGGTPGLPQVVAVGFAAVSVFMAVRVSADLSAGLVRAALGPVLALVALHLALGIEVHVRSGGVRSGAISRVIGELRERLLSLLGLGDDTRDARTLTRDRALARAARLATAQWAIARKPRLARALRASGAASDAGQRDRLLTQVAALRSIDDLMTASRPSPWI
ncbi:hypothetical protein [Catenuloplanes japonicus]|uniref:hypothetical protein n=1 Tax=Catenuloplanes japonicus TaxID=33876 RepID=UPI00068FC0D5|nr:hypothetical protein [Catenuloplanes japonicus]